ncbi:Bug family tripartite tricarboxylate transporter substrate binding protein [Gimesia sp.]|uniref:Bug family tripartite tricarboxylate transporter substrate binding protein n=1 Tax=Gimesia sp. TaxID=2024833 RepID=UPI003A8EAD2D
MNKTKLTGAVFSMVVALCGVSPLAHSAFPEKPITVIVPFGAGGGSDTLMRSLQKVIKKQRSLSQPIVVLNVGGAGSTIGSRRVKEAPADGYTYLLSHFALLSSTATKVADFEPNAFEPVAQVSQQCLLYAVQNDAKWKNLRELFDDAKANPGTIKEAINIGAVVHVTSWMLSDAYGGVPLRYVQAGGGAKRFASLLGGHVDAAQFSTSEFVRFSPKGIRALAYAGPTRHPELPDIPTAIEQGMDTVACINDWFFAPAGSPKENTQIFADAVIKAVKSDEIQGLYKKRKIDTDILTGTALQDKIDKDYAQIKSVSARHMDELRTLKEEQKKSK